MGTEVIYPQTYAITPPKGSDGPPETTQALLQAILAVLSTGASGGGGGSGGFVVVNGAAAAYDYQSFAYFTGTNNVQSITYRNGGAGGSIVAVTRFNYDAPGTSDANVTVIATTST